MSDTLTDLADLYERDPSELTDQDITEIIKRQRAAFASFSSGMKEAGTSKTKKQQKGPDIDLESLGL